MSNPDDLIEPSALPQRKRPAHGVYILPNRPTIVFLTVCTQGHTPWLATPAIHDLLRTVWQEADAWWVGRYVVMPGHLHLFCAPGPSEITLDGWVRYWKSQFTKRHKNPSHQWQDGHWDTRLRNGESYDAKWEYVRDNPVRHRLVENVNDWPFQGELHELPWS